MKVDILLRTRDYDRDYRWIFKPEYVDQVTEDKMSLSDSDDAEIRIEAVSGE